MDGLAEFSDVFCQITFAALVLLHCFKVQTEICVSSWEILGIRIPKVMPGKLRPGFFFPFILVLLTNTESKTLKQKIVPFFFA